MCTPTFFRLFSRATQRAPVLPPTRCKLPQKKGIYGGTGGLYVYGFLTAAALRLYICFVALGARISATYQGFIAPFSICFYCKLTYIICLRFPDCCCASLIYMLCSPRCPDFCHVSRLYCPFLYLLLLQAHLYLFILWQCFTSSIFHFYLSISYHKSIYFNPLLST